MEFKSLEAMANHLEKVVVKQDLPKAYGKMLTEIGKEAHHQAQDLIIGRTILMQKTGPYPAWTELKQRTIDAKRRAGLGKGGNPQSILFATGNLHDHIGLSIDVANSRVILGSNVEYAATHEYGDPSRKIPPRPFLGPALVRAQIELGKKHGEMFCKAIGGTP